MPTGATPQWKQLNLMNNSAFKTMRNTLKSTRTTLETIEKILDQQQNALNTISSIVQLVKNLERALHMSIYAFLDVITSQLRTFINNVKSTGVYALDLTTYHLQPPPLQINVPNIPRRWWESATRTGLGLNNADFETLDETARPFVAILQLIEQIPTAQRTSSQNEIKRRIEDYLYGRTLTLNIPDLIRIVQLDIGASVNDPSGLGFGTAMSILNLLLSFRYKAESYNEFVDVICDSLADANDIPESALASAMLDGALSLVGPGTIGSFSYQDQNNSSTVPSQQEANPWYNSVYKSGAPRFGENSYMKTFIFGACVDDIGPLVDMIQLVIKIFKNLENNEELRSFTDLSAFTNAASSIRNTFTEHWRQFLPMFDASRFNPTAPRRRNEPDFYGVTMNTLFADFFTLAEQCIDFLESFQISDRLLTDSITGAVEDVITKINSYIDRIRSVITFIQDIIYFIESLLSLSQLFMLSVDTKQGVIDTITQIKNAENFIPISIKDEEILDRFNISTEDKDAMIYLAQGRENQFDLIDNIPAYKNYLKEQSDLYAVELELKNNEYTSLSGQLADLQIIRDQIIEFEDQLDSSLYPSSLNDCLTFILASTQNIDTLETEYQTLLAADGNRAWLDTKIATLISDQTQMDDSYTVLIADVQSQIDALNPGMIDYDTQLANLESQKTFLENEKTTKHNEYQDLIDRYTAIKARVDAFLTFPITDYDDLIPITNKIDELQDQIDVLVSSYNQYMEEYNEDRNILLGYINGATDQIEGKQALISTKQNSIADKTAQLTFLQITDPTNPLIPTLISEIATLNSDITILQNEIAALQEDINGWYDDIDTLDAEKEEHTGDEVKLQEDLYTEQTVYVRWKASETKRLDKYFAQVDFDLDYMTWKMTLHSIVTPLIETYIPSFTDPEYAELITQLTENHDLKTEYKFDSYSIQNNTVFPVIEIPESVRVQNVIIKIEGEDVLGDGVLRGGTLEGVQREVDILSANYTTTLNKYNDMPSDAEMPQLLEETRTYVEQSQYFNPDKKMYFAGFLICWGWIAPEDAKSDFIDFGAATQAFQTEWEKSGGTWNEILSETEDLQGNIDYLMKKLGIK